MKTLPHLIDDDGFLQFLVAETTKDDDEGMLRLMLAATGDERAVGLYLELHMLTGNRVYVPALLRTIGVPSDGLVRALARAWGLDGTAMEAEVPCWVWPPHDRSKGTDYENAKGYTPRDLTWMDADLSLQIHGGNANGGEMVWFPLQLRSGERVSMHVAADERAMLLKLLTGTIRACHHD